MTCNTVVFSNPNLSFAVGVYLSDLTFIDVAAATVSQHENGGSWGRCSKENRLNNLLRIITNFQQSSYRKLFIIRTVPPKCYLF